MGYVATEDRRKQLVDATVRVVAQHGVSKASTRLIAKEAGTNIGALHYAFGTKEELFAAVMQKTLNYSEGPRFNEMVPVQTGLRRAVTFILKDFRAAVTRDSEVALAQYEMLFWSLHSAECSQLAKQVYVTYLDILESNLARAAAPRERTINMHTLARYVLMLVDGLYIQWLTLGEGVTDEELPVAVDSLLALAKALSIRTTAH